MIQAIFALLSSHFHYSHDSRDDIHFGIVLTRQNYGGTHREKEKERENDIMYIITHP